MLNIELFSSFQFRIKHAAVFLCVSSKLLVQLIIHTGNSSHPFAWVPDPEFKTILSAWTYVHVNTVRAIGLKLKTVDLSNKKVSHAVRNSPVDGVKIE